MARRAKQPRKKAPKAAGGKRACRQRVGADSVCEHGTSAIEAGFATCAVARQPRLAPRGPAGQRAPRPAQAPRRPAQAGRSARLSEAQRLATKGVYVMLVHDEGCKNPGKWTVMSRNTTRAGCAFEVVTHVMKGVEVKKGMCGKDFIASRMVLDEVRVAAKWGDKSVFEAMLATMFWAMEEYPNAQVFYFASGYCVPLQGPTGHKKLLSWAEEGRPMAAPMWDEVRMDATREAWEAAGGILAEYAEYLYVHPTWVALDRRTAQLAADRREEVLQQVEAIMNASGGPRLPEHCISSSSSSSSVRLDVAPDEYFLTVLRRMVVEQGLWDWNPVQLLGTVGFSPPDPCQAQQLARSWRLPGWQDMQQQQQQQQQQQGKPEPLELPPGDPADLARAWYNTQAATNWQYQHPITWGKGRYAQKMLWVEGGSRGERVVVGSLKEQLEKFPVEGDVLVFVVRKVGELAPSEDKKHFNKWTLWRLRK